MTENPGEGRISGEEFKIKALADRIGAVTARYEQQIVEMRLEAVAGFQARDEKIAELEEQVARLTEQSRQSA